MIKFIRGNYAGSLEELSGRKFVREEYYSKICLIKLINLFKLEKMKSFHHEIKFCLRELAPYGPNRLVWPRSLNHIILGNQWDPFSLGGRGFEIWFKAGMYLQRDVLLEGAFRQLSEESEEDLSLQELITIHHYRQRRYENAFMEAQRLTGTNVHNILGRMYWAGGNLKKAWAHFKKAVEYREDSLNALEYLPSLAWILNYWSEGIAFLTQLGNLRALSSEEAALLSAFHIQEGNWESARRGLNLLKKNFSKELPLKGLLMGSYISLRLKDGDSFVPYALRSCLAGEGLNCWLLLQQLGQKDFESLVDRDEMIFAEDTPDIEQYRQEVEITPLREKIFVRSKDIRELDRREFSSKRSPSREP